jgi:hypothetical protein
MTFCNGFSSHEIHPLQVMRNPLFFYSDDHSPNITVRTVPHSMTPLNN